MSWSKNNPLNTIPTSPSELECSSGQGSTQNINLSHFQCKLVNGHAGNGKLFIGYIWYSRFYLYVGYLWKYTVLSWIKTGTELATLISGSTLWCLEYSFKTCFAGSFYLRTVVNGWVLEGKKQGLTLELRVASLTNLLQ